jgi:hypothetical protein
MARHRILRLLGIAMSAGFGILCLLLMSLWVRSYFVDSLFFFTMRGPYIQAASKYGRWYIQTGFEPGFRAFGWDFGDGELTNEFHPKYGGDEPHKWNEFDVLPGQLYFEWPGNYDSPYTNSVNPHLVAPQWVFVVFSAACAVVPWFGLPERFSLRTLLLATTLVAIVLGLILAMR